MTAEAYRERLTEIQVEIERLEEEKAQSYEEGFRAGAKWAIGRINEKIMREFDKQFIFTDR